LFPSRKNYQLLNTFTHFEKDKALAPNQAQQPTPQPFLKLNFKMYTFPIYLTPQLQPPPFSHPRPHYPYYGYRPGTVPQFIYPQQVPVSTPVPMPVFVSQVQPVLRFQASNPTPLPVPAGTPSEVRYEMLGGVLTPVRHYHFNSPPRAGRGFNAVYGFGS